MPAVRRDVYFDERGESRPRLPAFRQALPDRRNQASRDALLRRVWAEFEEMRGLTLTCAQAARLFTLREDICLRILTTLVRDGLLRVTADGRFARHPTGT